MTDFQVGDKVRCINNDYANTLLKLNQTYTVKGFAVGLRNYLKLEGVIDAEDEEDALSKAKLNLGTFNADIESTRVTVVTSIIE